MDIKKIVATYNDELIELRRYFHRHPEESGKEDATIAYINEYLKKLNLKTSEVKDGGLLGIIDSGKPGKTLLLRADVDALAINENSCNLKGPKQCLSEAPGFSHACGHDCHMAMNMIVGKILTENKDAWTGKIVLCFERGEECGGNVRYLLPYIVKESGLKIDGCYATHVRWDIPVGKVNIQAGPVMAGGLGFSFKIIGKAGHGSRPDLANSPIDCFAAIYNDLNATRMRTVSPNEILTFSLGELHAGTQINVIPGELTFSGTSRFFSLEKAGQHFFDTLMNSVKHNCEIYHCKYETLRLLDPLFEVNNNACLAELGKQAIAKDLGSDVFYTPTPWMACESYSLFLQEFPGVLSFTGIANPQMGTNANHHTPEFDVDEAGLATGVSMGVSYALAFLSTNVDPKFTPNPEPIEILAARNL